MNIKKPIFVFFGLLALLAVGATALVSASLYNGAVERQRLRLAEMAQSQARVIAALASYDEARSYYLDRQSAADAARRQIRAGHKKNEGFGRTGELAIAYRGKDAVSWLTRRYGVGEIPSRKAQAGDQSSPMERALSGHSGTMVGTDYRNIEVLAAYQPVEDLAIGVVAKLDLEEIREPYMGAAILFSALGLILAALAGALVYAFGTRSRRLMEAEVIDLRAANMEKDALIEKRAEEMQCELSVLKIVKSLLVQAKAEADAASQAKSEFLANMSHELRTPLNSIIGFSEVIKDEMFGRVGNEKYKDYSADIYNSGTHLLTLINDVLDVSKIEAGEFDLVNDTFDPREPLLESLRMVEQRVAESGLKLTSSIPANTPLLIADQRRFKQMVLNLLSNSIKFTPKGGQVHISIIGSRDGGLEVEVADNGVGIREEDLLTVLEPFGQARNNTMVKSAEGTGLGLPLINMLIQLHNGTMKLSSRIDAGTKVILRFPKDRVIAPPLDRGAAA